MQQAGLAEVASPAGISAERLVGWSTLLASPITLLSGIVARRRTVAYLREWLKLQIRALRRPRDTRQWLALLNSNAALHQLASRHPRLVRKIYRPYLSLTLGCHERLRALAAHYALMSEKGLMPLILSAACRPVVLTSFLGKSGARYEIALLATSTLDREGELVLRLMHTGKAVYSIAFSILDEIDHSGRTAFIGCIQGPKGGGDALQRIREAGRDLHGLRPKNLMVALVRQIGYDWGCRRMILVGNRNRAAHHSVRKGRVFADYDLLWREIGASARDDGNYQLPCEDLPDSLDMAAIPSRKRSQMRRRYELLQSLIATVRSRLSLQESNRDLEYRSASAAIEALSAKDERLAAELT